MQACAVSAVHARSGTQDGVLEEALGPGELVVTEACCLMEASRLAEAEQALVQFTLTFGPVHSFGGTVALSLSA